MSTYKGMPFRIFMQGKRMSIEEITGVQWEWPSGRSLQMSREAEEFVAGTARDAAYAEKDALRCVHCAAVSLAFGFCLYCRVSGRGGRIRKNGHSWRRGRLLQGDVQLERGQATVRGDRAGEEAAPAEKRGCSCRGDMPRLKKQ